MGLFDRFKAKKPSHEEKVRLAYKCFRAELVETVFPGKEAQADRIIRSLSIIYGLDLGACDASKYNDILTTYSDIWIRKKITQTNDEMAITSLCVKHGDLVKDRAMAQTAYSYITKAMKDTTLVLETRDDLKKLNPTPPKAPVPPIPSQEDKKLSSPKVELQKQLGSHIRLNIGLCNTLDNMISTLESYCVSIIGAYCKGKGEKYGTLPILPVLSEKDIEVISADILLHVKEGAPADREPVKQAAFNAVTLGMFSAGWMTKDKPVSPSELKDRFLQKRTSPSWLPKEALILARVAPKTEYWNKIETIITEMTGDFSRAVLSVPGLSDEVLHDRAVAAIGIAYKAGCSIYLREQNIIIGNNSEEDQEKLNSLFSKKKVMPKSGEGDIAGNTIEDEDSRNAELILVTLSGPFLGYRKFPMPSYWSREYITSFLEALSGQVDLKQTSYKPYSTAVRNAIFIGLAMGYAYRMHDKALQETISKELISSEADPLKVPDRALQLMNEDIQSSYSENKKKQIHRMTTTVDIALFAGDRANDKVKFDNYWKAYIWAGFRGGISMYMLDDKLIDGKVFVEDQQILEKFFDGL